ncbi:MAG: TonB-dependent receptor [Paludibacter sp.]|nr:TonB-dependent receptor [Paludibacter sp.]
MNKVRSIKNLIPLMMLLWFVNSAVIGQNVTGKVTDADTFEELIGVTVMVKGTNIGTITDVNGIYRIAASKDNVLTFSFIGKESVDIRVTSTTHNVSLKDHSVAIDEVIVVGYGSQRKESVVGAISNVKGDDIARITGVTNISSALSGMVPGLTAMSYGGKPGQDEAQLLIRAKSTWNGMEPLILVDGIERDMNNLDANEIESISVLKDASATAVFGVRGGNGVILVTTKRGRESKPVLRVNGNVGIKSVSKVPEYINSYEARWLRNQAIENQVPVDGATWGYITPISELKHYRDQDLPYQYPNISWRDEMLKKHVWSQRVNMDIRGGTKFLKYFNSLSYVYDGDVLNGEDLGQGYIPRNDYSRLNFRSNFDFSPTSTTTFSVDIDGASGKQQSMGAPAYLVWLGVYGKGPDDYPIKYEDGTYANNLAGYNMENPVELLNYGGRTTETRTDINTTFSLNQKLDFIIKGLSLSAKANFHNFYYSEGPNIAESRNATKYVDWRNGREVWNYPTAYINSKHGFNFVSQKPVVSSESAKTNVYQNLMYQISTNYERKFTGGHNVTGLFLFKRRESSMGSNFPSYREEWAGRITYDYKNKYLFETNGAYNGSEKFDRGQKFGFFPSMAAGWVISNESFMNDIEQYVNFLKVRYSWGKVGSDNNIPKWLYVSQWQIVTNSAKLGYPNAVVPPFTSYNVSNIGNSYARWETATKNDIALEATMFSNFLSINFDYYWGRRDDIFMSAAQRNIPPWFGADPVAANIGQTKEQGWEFEAKIKGTTPMKLNYFASAAVSYARDEVIYQEDPYLLPDYQKKAGYQIGQTRSYLNEGVIQSWDEMYTGVMWQNNPQAMPGNFRQIDYNGDGYIDANDVVPYGYPDRPQYTINFTVGGDYKGFSLLAQIYGTRNATLQQWIYEYTAPHYASVVDRLIYDDVWLPDNPNSGSYRHPSFMYTGNNIGNYNYKDGSMWRLKNVELAYQLKNKVLEDVGINSLRLFLSGNNLWLFSHLNEDRETGSIRNVHDHAVKYPMTKTYNLGFNIQF